MTSRRLKSLGEDLFFALTILLVLSVLCLHGVGTSGVSLQEKLSLQGQGIGYIVDVSSDCFLIVYHAIQLGYCTFIVGFWNAPKALQMTLSGGMTFSIIACVFHLVQDETGGESNPLFMVSLGAIGCFVIFGLSKGMQELGGESTDRAVETAVLNLVCLMLFTVICFMMGNQGCSLLNHFMLNGYVFVFISRPLNIVLKITYQTTGIVQFMVARFMLPCLVCSFVFEGYVVRNWHIDAHACVHIFSMGLSSLINSGLWRGFGHDRKTV